MKQVCDKCNTEVCLQQYVGDSQPNTVVHWEAVVMLAIKSMLNVSFLCVRVATPPRLCFNKQPNSYCQQMNESYKEKHKAYQY